MRYNLVKLLLEDIEDELHVFDFDDTLGITDAPTLVAGVEFLGGDPEDLENYRAITDMSSRLQSTTGQLKGPDDININNPNISGGQISGETSTLDGAQVVVVDTVQYRDWKEKYVRAGDHARIVVTARKGETDLDTFGGGKKKAQNVSDIESFVQDQVGIKPDEVYGAADISNATADNKKKLIKWLAISNDSEEIHFYDDDPENANAVSDLCDDDELVGTEINIYNAEFEDEGIPEPMTCMPKTESRWLKLAGIEDSSELLNG